MSDPFDLPTTAAPQQCPLCQQAIILPTDTAPPFTCVHCGGQFLAAMDADEAMEEPDAVEETECSPDAPAELDANRIRQLARLRRGAYRSRSYCWIGAILALFVAIGTIKLAYNEIRDVGWRIAPAAYLLIAAGMGVAAFALLSSAEQFTRAARKSDLAPPVVAPDFSPLNNGNQASENLEKLSK